MGILKITEEENTELPKVKPIKEKMDIYIPDIPSCVPNRNGFISVFCGSGGSGKTNLLLNLFKTKAVKRIRGESGRDRHPTGIM